LSILCLLWSSCCCCCCCKVAWVIGMC
jgi:hypothetical protein